MEQKSCQDCGEYLQHYVLLEGKLWKVDCGHCRKFIRKRKRPDDKVCEQFVQGTSVKERMVTKEYLTKALLQRVLDMDLYTAE